MQKSGVAYALEEPSIFEIGPRRKCRDMEVPCGFAKRLLGSLQKRAYCGVDFHDTTTSTNNNEGDTRRKYIATIEKPARYLRFDVNQKTVKQPGHSMSCEAPIVPWQAAVALWVSGFVAKCFFVRDNDFFHCGSVLTSANFTGAVWNHRRISLPNLEDCMNISVFR